MKTKVFNKPLYSLKDCEINKKLDFKIDSNIASAKVFTRKEKKNYSTFIG